MSDDNDKAEKTALELEKLQADLDKTNKERQKLQKELDSYDERLQLDRKRITNDRVRFFWETVRLLGVAVITGAIGYFTTRSTKAQDFERSRSEFHYERFYNALSKMSEIKDPHAMCDEACRIRADFQSFTSPDIRDDMRRVDSLCKVGTSLSNDNASLNAEVNGSHRPDTETLKKIDAVEGARKNLQQSLAGKTVSVQQKEDLERLEDSLNKLIAKAQIVEISNKSQVVTEDYVKKTEIVQNISSEIKQDASQRKMADGYPKTAWFKQGYFLVFDHMKIYLQDLDAGNGTIAVEICRSTSTQACTTEHLITTDQAITKNNPYSFTEKGYAYVIRLDHIGPAGKNPFTKAGYITFEKYEQ
jgi:hypothetical protein